MRSWFDSFLNLGNFTVATCVTYLLSLLIRIESNEQNLPQLIMNYSFKSLSLILFILGIIYILLNWIIYEIRFKALDIDNSLSWNEIFSLLFHIASIALLTVGITMLIDPEFSNTSDGSRYYVIIFGIALILQPIADLFSMLNAVKDRTLLAGLLSVFGAYPTVKMFRRLNVRFLTGLFVLCVGFKGGILLGDGSLGIEISNNIADIIMDSFICCVLSGLLVWNLILMSEIIEYAKTRPRLTTS